MRFSIVNLGCKVNRVESDAVAAQLLERGAEACEPAAADLIVVNTCTVTGEAEKKTRKAVRQALRANAYGPRDRHGMRRRARARGVRGDVPARRVRPQSAARRCRVP